MEENKLEALTAVLVIAVVFALGDFVASKTKAICSMIFVSGLIFLVGFWFIIPKTLFADSQLIQVGILSIPILLVYMGTLMKLKDLREEWKTVLIAFGAVVAVGISMLFVASPLIGKQFAIAGAGPISGGVVATFMVNEAATAKGLDDVAVFATLLLVLQTFVGLPIASIGLSKEAKKLHAQFRNGEFGGETGNQNAVDPEKPTWQLFPPMPKQLQTPFILIMKTVLVGWLAFEAAKLTGGAVNKYILCLIFGMIFYEIGFLEHKIMDKATATGFLLFPLMVIIFLNLPKATPDMVLKLITPIVMAFAVSVVGIGLFTFVLGKVCKYSWALSLAIGVTCMFGFPGTFIVSQEVCQAVAETPEEKEFLLSRILPKMLVAGFTTVTIASVVLAGVLVKYI